MLKKINIVIIIFILYHCSTQNNQNVNNELSNEEIEHPVVIQIGKQKGNTVVESHFNDDGTKIADITKIEFAPGVIDKKIYLSSITDSIEYIPLETNKHCIISDIRAIHLTTKDIFILTRGGIYRFSKTGKFLNRIGNRGRGPHEYISLGFSFEENEMLQKVYISDDSRKKLMCFNFNGQFEYEIGIPGNTEYTLVIDDSIFYTVNKDYVEPNNSRLFRYNKKGDTLMSYSNPISFSGSPNQQIMMASSFDFPLYRYNNQVFFKDFYNDTIFLVYPDRLEPYYVVDLGILRLPVESYPENGMSWTKFQPEALKFLKTRVEETDHSLYITTNLYQEFEANKMHIWYDKKFRTPIHVVHSHYKDPGFINDIDGGRNFWPRYISRNQELVTYYEMFQLKDILEDNKAKVSKWLREVIEKKDISDNPVIVIIKEK